MKKDYIKPEMEMMECDMDTMLCGSGVSSDYGIEYGGIDEDGSLNPESVHIY